MKSNYVEDHKIVYKYRLWNEDSPTCSILFDVEAYSYAGKPSSKLIKEKAADLTQGITDPAEKLKRLYDFCTHDIVNLNSENSGFSLADRVKMDKNETAIDTLKTGPE